MTAGLVITTTDDGVRWLRLDRPDARNAIDLDLQAALATALDAVAADDDIRAVVLTGTDPAFCAGGDLGRFTGDRDHVAFRRASQALTDVVERLEVLDRPVVAAINGLATGVGTQLALACDVRIAAEEARFVSREGHLGLLPGHGGLTRLLTLAGAGAARDLALGGLTLDAHRAHQLGLVSEVVAREDLDDRVTEVVASILRRGRESYAVAKHVLRVATAAQMAPGLAAETLGQSLLATTDDHHARLDRARDR